jgi:uncharacterized protein involved in type VI secretion and phage assembly
MPTFIDEMSTSTQTETRISGVAVAQVISNLDSTGGGRVQLKLPWLPGFEPWARVAVLLAGMNRGTYFIPQVGDEVLVAFEQGDVRQPFVIGCLWNGTDTPPAASPLDPVAKRIIRTPLGHVMEFDDTLQSVTITTLTQQTIKMDATQIELSTTGGSASIKLETSGKITLQAATTLELKAPSITLEGLNISIKGSASTSVEGGATCSIQAGLVKIN